MHAVSFGIGLVSMHLSASRFVGVILVVSSMATQPPTKKYNLKGVHSVRCKPRSTIVALNDVGVRMSEASSAAALFVPDVVLAKRCMGYCGVSVSCLPDKVATVKTWVKEFNLFKPKSGVKLRAVQIENHLSCKCGCTVVAGMCPSPQKFDSQRCRCKEPPARDRVVNLKAAQLVQPKRAPKNKKYDAVRNETRLTKTARQMKSPPRHLQ